MPYATIGYNVQQHSAHMLYAAGGTGVESVFVNLTSGASYVTLSTGLITGARSPVKMKQTPDGAMTLFGYVASSSNSSFTLSLTDGNNTHSVTETFNTSAFLVFDFDIAPGGGIVCVSILTATQRRAVCFNYTSTGAGAPTITRFPSGPWIDTTAGSWTATKAGFSPDGKYICDMPSGAGYMARCATVSNLVNSTTLCDFGALVLSSAMSVSNDFLVVAAVYASGSVPSVQSCPHNQPGMQTFWYPPGTASTCAVVSTPTLVRNSNLSHSSFVSQIAGLPSLQHERRRPLVPVPALPKLY